MLYVYLCACFCFWFCFVFCLSRQTKRKTHTSILTSIQTDYMFQVNNEFVINHHQQHQEGKSADAWFFTLELCVKFSLPSFPSSCFSFSSSANEIALTSLTTRYNDDNNVLTFKQHAQKMEKQNVLHIHITRSLSCCLFSNSN